LFQSSPSPKARSYKKYISVSEIIGLGVPILSQPEGQELLICIGCKCYTYNVPILSQPEGQELQQLYQTF
jgi:hypothetical protein